MPKSPSRSAQERTYGSPSSALRRALLGGLVLAMLLAVAGLLAYLTHQEGPAAAQPVQTPKSTPKVAPPEATVGKRAAVASPPKT
ncbi:hypothetical protein ACFV23_11985, partial [Streptomyces sp. NPDC059627]